MEHWFADLCVAVAAEDPERFEAILLRPEVDVNESVEWWSGDLLNCGTALRYCAGHGTAWMVGRLVALGADPNPPAPDPDRPSPLAAAVSLHLDDATGAAIALLLLGAGADPRQTWLGAPLLHHAAAAGSAARLRVLLEAGVSADERDPDGRTALHAVAESACGPVHSEGPRAVIALLRSYGANPTVADAQGRTPAALAEWADVVAALI